MSPLQTSPYSLTCGEGRKLNSFGTMVVVKATTEQTSGVFDLFDVTCPVGYATSLHIHYAEDAAIYVLKGMLAIFWGSNNKKAVAGSYFYQPRGTPHGFRVDRNAPARLLFITIPAGLERFVIEHELSVPESELEMDAARYKIEVLGPLPE